MKKLKVSLKAIQIIENICFFAALGLLFWVDWRLGVALMLYESNVSLMLLRFTDWRS